MLIESKNMKTYMKIRTFLEKVDKNFPVPLSEKQNLDDFANKLLQNGTICVVTENEEIVSMVAGYTDNIINNIAYISILATIPDAYGNGFATQLVKEFISICIQKNISAVHLYAVASNIPAMKLYHKLGFIEWKISDEPRPEDMHLIYYI